jgi:hypothetical protein
MKLPSVTHYTALNRHAALLFQALGRYRFLIVLLALATSETSAFAQEGTSAEPYVVANTRSNWRNCKKCQVLFYSNAEPGSCAAGGVHAAAGPNFVLPFGGPEKPNDQAKWHECKSCKTMFYNGYKGKGHCPGSSYTRDGKKLFGEHVPDNSTAYVLPHDIPPKPTTQPSWRFCNKCFAMFYDGFPVKGVCPQGGGHVAAGYNFVLPHSR